MKPLTLYEKAIAECPNCGHTKEPKRVKQDIELCRFCEGLRLGKLINNFMDFRRLTTPQKP